MPLSFEGELVNMLMDAGYRIDWPGMWCDQHPLARTCGLFHVSQRHFPIAVIPCAESENEIIFRAADMVTYPGGITAWFAAKGYVP